MPRALRGLRFLIGAMSEPRMANPFAAQLADALEASWAAIAAEPIVWRQTVLASVVLRLGYWGQPLLLFFIFHAADREHRLGQRRLLRLQ